MHYGFWVIMLYQHRFISYNKCMIQVQDSDSKGREAMCIKETSVPATEFYCGPKMTLKNNIRKKNI